MKCPPQPPLQKMKITKKSFSIVYMRKDNY